MDGQALPGRRFFARCFRFDGESPAAKHTMAVKTWCAHSVAHGPERPAFGPELFQPQFNGFLDLAFQHGTTLTRYATTGLLLISGTLRVVGYLNHRARLARSDHFKGRGTLEIRGSLSNTGTLTIFGSLSAHGTLSFIRGFVYVRHATVYRVTAQSRRACLSRVFRRPRHATRFRVTSIYGALHRHGSLRPNGTLLVDGSANTACSAHSTTSGLSGHSARFRSAGLYAMTTRCSSPDRS